MYNPNMRTAIAVGVAVVILLILGAIAGAGKGVSSQPSSYSITPAAPLPSPAGASAPSAAPTPAAPVNTKPTREIVVARGCAHYISQPGVYIPNPDWCITGNAYLLHANGATYIERFDTTPGNYASFDDMPYPGSGKDSTGSAVWTFE